MAAADADPFALKPLPADIPATPIGDLLDAQYSASDVTGRHVSEADVESIQRTIIASKQAIRRATALKAVPKRSLGQVHVKGKP